MIFNFYFVKAARRRKSKFNVILSRPLEINDCGEQ